MAKVTINPAVTVEVSPATYTLELNEQEFVALMALVGKVGGETEGTLSAVLISLWNSVFSKKFLEDYAFKGNTLHDDYRNQIKGDIYT